MVGITFCGALGAILTGGLAWWLLPKYGWHTLLGACAAPSVAMCGIALVFGEESPRYLFVSGQRARGIKLLKKIATQNGIQLEKGNFFCQQFNMAMSASFIRYHKEQKLNLVSVET